MSTNLPKPNSQEFVSISGAANMLGVSIDTVRRWEKKGLISSKRLDGKNRYFSRRNLEDYRQSKPLSISEASELLGVSASTLRRYEKRGLISPKRNGNSERLFSKETITHLVKDKRQPEVKHWSRYAQVLTPLKIFTVSLSVLVILIASLTKPTQESQVLGIQDTAFGFVSSIQLFFRNLLGIGSQVEPKQEIAIADLSETETKVIERVITERIIREVASVTNDSIDSSKIKNDTIENADIKDGAINSAKIEDNTVTSSDIKLGSIVAEDLADNIISATQLSDNLIFENGQLVDLSDITHSSTSVQGLVLPNVANDSPSSPVSGEGYIAWDTSGDQLIVYDGSSWNAVTGGGGGGGSNIVQEGDISVDTTVTTFDFLAADFAVSEAPEDEVNISIDYANSKIVRSDQNETITGTWTITASDLACTNCIGATEVSDLALGTDTTGNYIAGATANSGLTMTGTEGGTLGISVQVNKGLEVDSNGLSLIDCGNDQILKYSTGTSQWSCQDDETGGGGSGNSFETIDVALGTDPVADASTDTIQVLASGSNITITGDSTADSITFNIDESVLAGNGLTVSTDALQVNTGTGITISSDAVAVNQDTAFAWTNAHTFTLAEAEDLQVDWSVSGTQAGQGILVNVTNSSSSGNQYGLSLNNAASSGTTDSLLKIDNSDTDTVVTNAIEVANSSRFTNILTVGSTNLTSSEITVLDSGIAYSELTDSGTLTVTTVDINGGNIDGTVIGASSAAAGTFTTLTANTDAILPSNSISATEIDESTIASTSLSDTANIAYLNQSETIANDWTFGLAEAEDLAINWSVSGSQAGQAGIVTITNSSSSGAQNGFVINNAASTGTTDALLYLDNSDTDTVVTSAIQVANTSRFTNIFDIGGTTISATEVTILDSGITYGELTDSGTLTVTTVDINGGNIDGTTIGATTPAAATVTNLTSTGTVDLSSDSGADTITIGQSGTTDDTVTIAGNISLTDDQWSISATGVASGITGITATDLSCTDCIGPTEIADLTLGTDTAGNYVDNVTGGAGITVSGTPGEGWEPDLVVDLLDSQDGSGSTFSFSGLEFQGSGSDELTLLQGCSDGQVLKYDDVTDNRWECQNDNNSGGNTAWDSINDPVGNGEVVMSQTAQDLSWDMSSDAALNGLEINMTHDVSDSTTQKVFVVANINDSASVGTLETMLSIDNRDANETVTNGLLIENTGAGTMTNAINIQQTAGTITNAINANGTLISLTELQRLDGTTAALVDQDDFTSGDGSGATSSGSGLEAGSGGIGLLQGCADDQILKWNESSSVWECASDRATVSVRKTADETVNNSASLQDDDHLLFAIGANETWAFEFHVNYTTNNSANPDIKYAVTAPASATCSYGVVDHSEGLGIGNAAGTATCGGTLTIGSTTTAARAAIISGTIANAGNAGNVTFQFAQNTADATNSTIVKLGSFGLGYKLSGADLAEVYYSNTYLEPGTVVSLDGSLPAGVKASSGSYDSQVLGVVSTTPGLVIGEAVQSQGSVITKVALSGRVPVRVNNENGPIRPGDSLTSSSTSGVAMKATKSGPIIGTALNGYEGEGEGTVILFIKSSNATNMNLSDLIKSGVSVDAESLGQLVLAEFMQKDISVNPLEIITDRLAAGIEIITPKVTADEIVTNKIKANVIEGLEIYTDKVSSLADRMEMLEASQSAQLSAKTFEELYITGAFTVDGPLTFNGLSVFIGKATFGDIEFTVAPTFNKDTAGHALIKEGAMEVKIAFGQEYAQTPVINVTPVWEADASTIDNFGVLGYYLLPKQEFIVTKVTTKGFSILLEEKAVTDLKFNWMAITVKDAETFESETVIMPTSIPEASVSAGVTEEATASAPLY